MRTKTSCGDLITDERGDQASDLGKSHRMRVAVWVTLFALGALASASVVKAQAQGDPGRGGELFVENCAVCHGVDGGGRVGASLTNFPGIEVDLTIATTIANGIEGSVMPAWSQARGGPLSDQDIADIVAYITGVFEGTEPIEPLPTYQPPPITPLPDVPGDPSAGAAVYQGNCIGCHGENGEGRFGKPLAKAWPGNQPQLFIRLVVSEGIEGTAMPPWLQRNGGPLTDVQIADVAAYVLTLQPVSTSVTPTPAPEGPLNVTISLVLFTALAVLIVIGLVVYYRRA